MVRALSSWVRRAALAPNVAVDSRYWVRGGPPALWEGIVFENPFNVGMLVNHPALGMGRIVGIQGDRIHIYFHGQSKRWATKLTLDAGKKLLKVPQNQSHEWLDHLPPFEWNPREGAFGMECERLTHDQALATFLHYFPEGSRIPNTSGT